MNQQTRNDITVVVLTLNEAPNISRTLSRLTWATRVVVLDSGSTDDTIAICKRFQNVELLTRDFTTHSEQWNFAVTQTGITTDWVLALDADFVLSDELVDELARINFDQNHFNGFWISFRYCVLGKPLRGSLYPDVIALFRTSSGAQYIQDGHTQRLAVPGECGRLQGKIFHDDRKPLSRWLQSQDRYAALECDHLRSDTGNGRSVQDKIRQMIFIAPLVVPIYCLFGRGLILDGLPGLHYTFQRTIAECILSIKLIEKKLALKS